MVGLLKSGGISGAITNPDGKEELEWAAEEYKKIRKDDYDILRVVRNFNNKYTEKQIRKIKNYLFLEKHDLGDKTDYFDVDVAIAQSWQRLSSNHPESILPHDKLLIEHEIYEMYLQETRGLSQNDAHIVASAIYNYQVESDKYYRERKNKYGDNKRNPVSGRFNKS